MADIFCSAQDNSHGLYFRRHGVGRGVGVAGNEGRQFQSRGSLASTCSSGMSKYSSSNSHASSSSSASASSSASSRFLSSWSGGSSVTSGLPEPDVRGDGSCSPGSAHRNDCSEDYTVYSSSSGYKSDVSSVRDFDSLEQDLPQSSLREEGRKTNKVGSSGKLLVTKSQRTSADTVMKSQKSTEPKKQNDLHIQELQRKLSSMKTSRSRDGSPLGKEVPERVSSLSKLVNTMNLDVTTGAASRTSRAQYQAHPESQYSFDSDTSCGCCSGSDHEGHHGKGIIYSNKTYISPESEEADNKDFSQYHEGSKQHQMRHSHGKQGGGGMKTRDTSKCKLSNESVNTDDSLNSSVSKQVPLRDSSLNMLKYRKHSAEDILNPKPDIRDPVWFWLKSQHPLCTSHPPGIQHQCSVESTSSSCSCCSSQSQASDQQHQTFPQHIQADFTSKEFEGVSANYMRIPMTQSYQDRSQSLRSHGSITDSPRIPVKMAFQGRSQSHGPLGPAGEYSWIPRKLFLQKRCHSHGSTGSTDDFTWSPRPVFVQKRSHSHGSQGSMPDYVMVLKKQPIPGRSHSQGSQGSCVVHSPRLPCKGQVTKRSHSHDSQGCSGEHSRVSIMKQPACRRSRSQESKESKKKVTLVQSQFSTDTTATSCSCCSHSENGTLKRHAAQSPDIDRRSSCEGLDEDVFVRESFSHGTTNLAFSKETDPNMLVDTSDFDHSVQTFYPRTGTSTKQGRPHSYGSATTKSRRPRTPIKRLLCRSLSADSLSGVPLLMNQCSFDATETNDCDFSEDSGNTHSSHRNSADNQANRNTFVKSKGTANAAFAKDLERCLMDCPPGSSRHHSKSNTTDGTAGRTTTHRMHDSADPSRHRRKSHSSSKKKRSSHSRDSKRHSSSGRSHSQGSRSSSRRAMFDPSQHCFDAVTGSCSCYSQYYGSDDTPVLTPRRGRRQKKEAEGVEGVTRTRHSRSASIEEILDEDSPSQATRSSDKCSSSEGHSENRCSNATPQTQKRANISLIDGSAKQNHPNTSRVCVDVHHSQDDHLSSFGRRDGTMTSQDKYSNSHHTNSATLRMHMDGDRPVYTHRRHSADLLADYTGDDDDIDADCRWRTGASGDRWPRFNLDGSPVTLHHGHLERVNRASPSPPRKPTRSTPPESDFQELPYTYSSQRRGPLHAS